MSCPASIQYGLNPDFALSCGRKTVNCPSCGEPTDCCEQHQMEDDYGNPVCESCLAVAS